MKVKRRSLLLVPVLAVAAVLLGGGRWLLTSLDYVSTDEAEVKADVLTISPEVAGRIQVLTKEEGHHVLRGETLVRLESRNVAIDIRRVQAELEHARNARLQARAEVEFARAKQREQAEQTAAAMKASLYGLEDSRVELDKLQTDRNRTQRLLIRDLISRQEMDHAEAEVRRARARVSLLEQKVREKEALNRLAGVQAKEISIRESELHMREAGMRQVQQKLAALKHELALRTIRSPVTGVVAKKDKQAGEHIEPGQPIYMIVDTTKFWIEAKIEETKIRFVRRGSPAVIYIDSYPGIELSGTVFEVGEATVSAFSLFSPAKLTGVFIKSVQRIPVKIRVDNSNGLLKVGMLANVWIKKHLRYPSGDRNS